MTHAVKRTYFIFLAIVLCLTAAGAAVASPHAARPNRSTSSPHAARPTRSTSLTLEDRKHLLEDNFQIYGAVSAIPEPVRKAIEGRKLMGPSYGSPPFPMVDPGKSYNSTDAVLDPTLPFRRLIFVAVSAGYCLIAYEQGGIGYSRDAVLYRLTGNKAKVTWRACVYGNFQTFSDVRAAVRAKRYYEME